MNFQGLDLNDEGFHATQYQQFFSHPESVQYTFIFWFSGFIGGLFYKVFSFAGLWGLRFAGALITTLTALVTYKLLKHYVKPIVLMAALAVLAALSIQAGPRDLYYNNLSAFLYIAGIFFLFRGLAMNKPMYIFTGAIIFGMNVFTRLPNILGAGLIVTIAYYQLLKKETIKAFLSKYIIFITGFISAFFIILGLMYLIGDLDVFVNSIKSLYTTNNNARTDDGLSGSYGISNLVKLLAAQYIKSIIYALLSLAVIFGACFAIHYFESKKQAGKIFIVIFRLAFIAILVTLLLSDKVTSSKISFLLTGICLISSVFVFLIKTSAEFKILTLAGLFIILVHPFGSATGIITVVPYSLWISVPLSFQLLLSFRVPAFTSTNPGSVWHSLQIHKSLAAGLAVITIFILYWLYVQPYFGDFHKRPEMLSTIDNKNMKMIFTSKERSEQINELLEASKQYMKPNDTVLAYDCIPMFHFMTETIPYLSNPSPWFYSNSVFKNQLNTAYQSTHYLPVIVRQTIKIIEDDGSRWPELKPKNKYLDWERNKFRNNYLNAFISNHQYKKAWSNESFEIYIPINEPMNTSRLIDSAIVTPERQIQ